LSVPYRSTLTGYRDLPLLAWKDHGRGPHTEVPDASSLQAMSTSAPEG
jgi:hypothetical protein